MARKILCPLLCLTLFSTGCSTTAPEIKQAIDPKSGDIIQYSSASDGRPFIERNPAIGAPVIAAALVGEEVGKCALVAVIVVGAVGLCLLYWKAESRQ